MGYVYIAESLGLTAWWNDRYGSGYIVKVGFTDDLVVRLEHMRLGWPLDGGQGPALALHDDWDFITTAASECISERFLLAALLEHFPHRSFIAMHRFVCRAAYRSKVPEAVRNLNGIRSLRLIPAAAVRNPGRLPAGEVGAGAEAASNFADACLKLRHKSPRRDALSPFPSLR